MIISPTSVWIEKRKGKFEKCELNLNSYRNNHFIINNKIKQAYCEALYEQLYKLRLNPPITIEYTLYRANLRKFDISNVLSVIDKYFSDALVYYKCLEDDNFNYIEKAIYQYGGVRKEPCVEIKFLNC